MKRLRWVILAAVLSLVAAGAAIAHEIDGPNTVKFNATFKGEQARYSERVCANATGYLKTHAVYWGTVEWQLGDRSGTHRARVKLHTHGAKDGVTKVSGNIRLYNGDHFAGRLHFKAVSSDGGHSAMGFAQGGMRGHGRMLGTARIDVNDKTAVIQIGSGETFSLGLVKYGPCRGVRAHDHKTDQVKPQDTNDKKSDVATSDEKAA